MTASTSFAVTVADQELSISAKVRSSGPELVLMLHGLGCAKESFDDVFSHRAFRRFSLCAIDLPGHGGSGVASSDLGVDELAEAVVGLTRQLDYERIHLVCHSLGGAVGLQAVNEIPRLGAFVNIEGNLVPDDCGIVSRRTAAQDTASFVASGFAAFVADLRRSDDPAARVWASWYAACDPRTVHSIARSLVEVSDSGKLLGVFTALDEATYVYGERSDVSHLIPLLTETDVVMIPGSGHFPMVDAPATLWGLLAGRVLAASCGMVPIR